MAVVPIAAVNYDAFTTVAFADQFLGGDVARAASWTLKNADAKGRGLVSATRMLLWLPWLAVPAPLPTDAEVDEVIQQVTAMLASDLLDKPRLFADASGNSNVKNVRAGSVGVEFFRPVEGGPPIPLALWNALVAAGLVGIVESGDQTGTPFVSGVSEGCRPLGGRYEWDWPVAERDYC